MYVVKRRLHKLMKAYKAELTKDQIIKNREEYHNTYISSIELDELSMSQHQVPPMEGIEEEDLMLETKIMQYVPNRKQIKALSSKIVEEQLKKDD